MKLNDNEKKVLNILEKDPYISQQAIADALSLSRPAVANLISGLQEKGYILGKPYVLRKDEYVTCIGGANLDYTFRLEEDMVMGTSNPVKSSISYGGVIRNVADNLSRLDHQVSLMSVVGDDLAGKDLLLYASKIMEVFAVDELSKKTTGGYYSIIGKNGHMNVGYADMSINDHMDRAWILEHKKHLRFSNWLIADTNLSKDALETLIDFSRQEEKKLAIVGVSGPKMKHLPEDLKGIEIIICNVDETQAYFKTNENDLDKLIKLWLDKGIKKAIITAGNKGCVFADQSFISHQKAIIVHDEDIIDVTGAGDAFSAAVLHGLINKIPFEQSVKFGVISSSLTIQSTYSVHPKLSINLIKKELEKMETYEKYLDIQKEVKDALDHHLPVVALESTIISHGMPYPENVKMAKKVESIIREGGAVPATIAIMNGKIKIGLTDDDLETLAKSKHVEKVSRRDLASIIASHQLGATTVASTMICAQMANIKFFVTGGIGGIHRGYETSLDVSADLDELAQTNVNVICAGAKAILDLPKTMEYLETKGVSVIGYQTDVLPAFYTRTSDIKLRLSVKDVHELAKIIYTKDELGLKGGILVANPILKEDSLDHEYINDIIDKAIEQSVKDHIEGKDVTPYLLKKIVEETKGESLKANLALVYNNARVGAKLAKAYYDILKNK